MSTLTVEPKKGYKSEAKQDYREIVWDNILSEIDDEKLNELKHWPDSPAKLMILPSKNGHEIDVLLNRGIHAQNIICVDNNPAVIATSEWRKKHFYVPFICCNVSDVHNKIQKQADDKYIIAANLDFCYNFNDDLIIETQRFLNGNDRLQLFCITLMKGRESKALTKVLEYQHSSGVYEEKRINALLSIIDYPNKKKCCKIYEGTYINSRVPMSYAVIKKQMPKSYWDKCLTIERGMNKFLFDIFEMIEEDSIKPCQQKLTNIINDRLDITIDQLVDIVGEATNGRNSFYNKSNYAKNLKEEYDIWIQKRIAKLYPQNEWQDFGGEYE